MPVPGSLTARPLLKWAGGKRQLLPALRRCYPVDFGAYLEPFVGSGAVFFDLYASGRLDGRRVRLADANPDLIGCYRAVRDQPDAVIDALATLADEHRAGGAAFYYEVRDRQFNPARATLADAAAEYTPVLAAMLIYLNRTGYNGLFRVNRAGAFNVPAGRYTNPRVCDPDHVRAVSRALSGKHISLECAPFEVTFADARRGDFIYCDPPYAPISRTANFGQYTAGGFGAVDQHRLRDRIVRAARDGVIVLVSNSSAPEIAAAYSAGGAQGAGLRVQRIPARRAINSRAAGRGAIDELVITNMHTGPHIRMTKARLRGAAAAREPRKRLA